MQFIGPLQNILLFNRRRIYIDNVYFRIHYVWSVVILTAFSVLITSKLYIGEPINCLASQDLKDIAKQFCFIHATFIRGKLEKGNWAYESVKDTEIYPGIRPGVKMDSIKFHTYYQWVWCVLMLQAVAFYFPHWIWEKLEKGTMMILIGNLNLPMLMDEKKLKHRKKILLYLKRNRGHHSFYSRAYILTEILNFINILFQIVFTNYFIENEFTTYGLNIFQITQDKPYMRNDALSRVFPTITSCRFATGGVAFGKVQHDILCVMNINIISEKIYIFMWFWFLFVFIATIFCHIYRLLTVSVRFRKFMLRKKVREKSQKECVNSVCDQCAYGDWFLIYKFSQNTDPRTFGDLVVDIDQAFRKWDSGKVHDDEEEEHLAESHSPIHYGFGII